jgi:hypothetical protein
MPAAQHTAPEMSTGNENAADPDCGLSNADKGHNQGSHCVHHDAVKPPYTAIVTCCIVAVFLLKATA